MAESGDEQQLRQCLDLCTTALSLSDTARSHVLSELRRRLALLVESPETLAPTVTAQKSQGHEQEPVMVLVADLSRAVLKRKVTRLNEFHEPFIRQGLPEDESEVVRA